MGYKGITRHQGSTYLKRVVCSLQMRPAQDEEKGLAAKHRAVRLELEECDGRRLLLAGAEQKAMMYFWGVLDRPASADRGL